MALSKFIDKLTRLLREAAMLLSFLDVIRGTILCVYMYVLHAFNYNGKQTKASNNLQLYRMLLGFNCDGKRLRIASGFGISCYLLHVAM